MALHLYNTLSRRLEIFKPIHDGQVGLYSCGPTVYWFGHIGNFRTYIFTDLLHRWLLSSGYKVNQVMNITDVGHLTDDADEGEDKMILAMRREGRTAHDIANFYTQSFLRDAAILNILPASRYTKATEHIPEQIALIQKIEAAGFAYRTKDGIYFDTAKLAQYGRLSGQSLSDKMAGARVAVKDKRNAADFALWKFSPTEGQREMEWDSPWGVGFPGWHLECSAMSHKYLGTPFDIHTGGIDHIPVHHENELAQTWAAENQLEANYWVHGEFLTVDSQKMSKSLQNIYTIPDLLDRGFEPLDFRYFVLSAHYRTLQNFTWEALQGAANALHKLRQQSRMLEAAGTVSGDYQKKFAEALDEDLNAPAALAVVWEMMKDQNLSPQSKGSTLAVFDDVLGLGLKEIIGITSEVPAEIEALVAAREKARLLKDWEQADELRSQILSHNWEVEDTERGPKVKPSPSPSVPPSPE